MEVVDSGFVRNLTLVYPWLEKCISKFTPWCIDIPDWYFVPLILGYLYCHYCSINSKLVDTKKMSLYKKTFRISIFKIRQWMRIEGSMQYIAPAIRCINVYINSDINFCRLITLITSKTILHNNQVHLSFQIPKSCVAI